MGSYESEWYGFEVDSKQHLMDLYIEPSFHPAVCVQFHEMMDGVYRAFYNYQPEWKEIVRVVKEYAYEQKMDSSTKANVALDQAASAGVFKSLAPVVSFLLEDDDRDCVRELYDEGLPSTDEHHQGLDGHSYTLKIYKDDGIKCYHTWCVTPLSWERLRKLVKIVVNRLDLDSNSYGAYIWKAAQAKTHLELPPHLRKDDCHETT